jgi:hypothetical protein
MLCSPSQEFLNVRDSQKIYMTKTTIGAAQRWFRWRQGRAAGRGSRPRGRWARGRHCTGSPVDMWMLIGIVSQDEYFFEGPKIRNSNFWMIAHGFHNFQLSFCEGNPKWSFCLLLWNHLLIVKFLPVTLFRELFLAFFNTSETRLWIWKLFRKPAMNLY